MKSNQRPAKNSGVVVLWGVVLFFGLLSAPAFAEAANDLAPPETDEMVFMGPVHGFAWSEGHPHDHLHLDHRDFKPQFILRINPHEITLELPQEPYSRALEANIRGNVRTSSGELKSVFAPRVKLPEPTAKREREARFTWRTEDFFPKDRSSRLEEVGFTVFFNVRDNFHPILTYTIKPSFFRPGLPSHLTQARKDDLKPLLENLNDAYDGRELRPSTEFIETHQISESGLPHQHSLHIHKDHQEALFLVEGEFLVQHLISNYRGPLTHRSFRWKATDELIERHGREIHGGWIELRRLGPGLHIIAPHAADPLLVCAHSISALNNQQGTFWSTTYRD